MSERAAIFGFVFLVEDFRYGRDERQVIARVRYRIAGVIGWAILGAPPEDVRPGVWVELKPTGAPEAARSAIGPSNRFELARVVG